MIVMKPDDLTRLLESASTRFHVGRNPKNPYPEGSIYYKFGDKEVNCGACEWGEMAEREIREDDPINPYKAPGSYQRRSWPHVLRNILGNPEVPRHVRRRLYDLAIRRGYKRFLDRSKLNHRVIFREMAGL